MPAIQESLELRHAPVAIRFCDEVPEGVSASADRVAGGCSFWELGTQKAFATRAVDHEACAIGVYTHNISGASERHMPELQTVLNVMNDMQYATAEDVEMIPVMEEAHEYVVYGPLEQVADPDVVMLFVDSRQSLVVAEAVQQVEKAVSPALGRPACAVVPQVVRTGRAAVSLGCCGARAYLDALTDDVALWALPAARLDEYTAHIATLSEANDVLGKLHALRRKAVEAGNNPTYEESMAELQTTS